MTYTFTGLRRLFPAGTVAKGTFEVTLERAPLLLLPLRESVQNEEPNE